jgi:hypothetical protein
MSLNHILYDIVPDNEKLDVKFKNVYCDQVVSGGSNDGDGYVNAQTGANISSPTNGVNVTTFLPTYATAIKNHSTFIWTFRSQVTLTIPVTTYLIDAKIPTALKTYFDAHPTAFSQYLISVVGMSNTTNSSPDFQANQLYYADVPSKIGSDTVRITMESCSNNGTGSVPNLQNLKLQIIFSGPAN